ncbi:MAG: addiction module toxin, HicA family [Dehalococcoidia bacterium]|nr:addiction module toxin, HicA family [Dehalococcoidia bacterium]
MPKVRDAIRLIEAAGWYLVATRGSYGQYKHLTRSGRVPIPGSTNADLPTGTWLSILRQAGIDRDSTR